MTNFCLSEGEARKNPADRILYKNWIASLSLAMTTLLQDYCHPEALAEESHKLIPAPCGRGSEGEGVTLDKSCEKLNCHPELDSG
ncbi:MAG: hypothetical protein NC191_04305 [Muribaculaceae bacterium]|nr:hypothetical protein [Muribaculaceae bacterium]